MIDGRKLFHMSSDATTREMLDVVNDNDEVIAVADRSEIYAQGLNNRIVHIFVIDPNTNNIFIQQRGPHVKYLPNYLCTSAGGHVSSGETYSDAAKREMKEELGLETDLTFISKFKFIAGAHEPGIRFISLYRASACRGIRFEDGEVAGGFFISIADLNTLLVHNTNIHPQLTACFTTYLTQLQTIAR